MPKFYPGIAGRRGYNPKGLILHNDAGSKNATAAFYRAWLKDHDAYSGFAHYYTASDGTYQAEDDKNVAWHSGNSKYNRDYIGIEACQSLGDSETFLANEEECLKLMAKLCKKYGITPNRDTIKLHQEVSSTTCPHRSYDLHGRSINDVKDYFIKEIKKYMNPKPAENKEFYTSKGRYESLSDTWFYTEKELNEKSRVNLKKGQYVYADEIHIETGRTGKQYFRGAWQLGTTKLYFSLNRKAVKKA